MELKQVKPREKMYFIRVKSNQSMYVHFLEKNEDSVSYIVKDTMDGACVFNLENAQTFIGESKANLEAVDVELTIINLKQ